MKLHSASELKYRMSILAADSQTLVACGLYCGLADLTGKRLEQAQLINSETSHVIIARRADVGGLLDSSCYLQIDGTLYIVDYMQDPRVPRPNMWVEIYCHAEGPLTVTQLRSDLLLEDGVSRLLQEAVNGGFQFEGYVAIPTELLLENGALIELESGTGTILLEGN